MVVEPKDIHATAGVLSEASMILACLCPVALAATVAPVMIAASSRSLLVIEPVGLLADTIADCVYSGKGALQAR
jgi:hypothetical protein